QAPGLAEAEAAQADLEKKLESSPKPAPIDAAGKVRAACLTALTKARRAGLSDADQADALLGELSRARVAQAGAAAATASKNEGDLLPSRDERGVVLTLRSLFKGEGLTPEGEATLKELGKVAAAHPNFSVQIVIHDATTPTAAEGSLDHKRGEAIA